MFRGEGMGLKLSKVYYDRRKARQTGRFEILLFEGEGDANGMYGYWAFYGYENTNKFAGQSSLIKK